MTDVKRRPRRRIVIIGSGFGGIGLGIRLKRAGIDDFTILEKAASLGGTWRDNTYPGAACDVPSMLYSFSFAPKTDWSRKWSPQPEIREYMETIARDEGVLPHVRFGVEVESARFDEATARWTLRTTAGEELDAEVVVTSVGQLHHPSLPTIPGLDSFAGPSWHSARWRHDVDLSGKRVAVIGNAASAIQLIPEVAKRAATVTVFQRSANWMVPRGDRPFRPFETRLLSSAPWLFRAYRGLLWLRHEMLFYPVMRRNRVLSALMTTLAKAWLRKEVPDHTLRRTLTPDYPVGAKRVLISDDYYAALRRENVVLVTEPIERFEPSGIVTRGGTLREADVAIFATGFRTNPFLAPMRFVGVGGRTLEEEWAKGAHAHYGMTVPAFPNLFLLYGPNTNLGHNSILFMLECQYRYLLDALRRLDESGADTLEVRREALERYDAELQRALAESSWSAVEASWYKDAAGRLTNNWPWSTAWYAWKTRRIDPADYRFAAARVAARRGDRVAA